MPSCRELLVQLRGYRDREAAISLQRVPFLAPGFDEQLLRGERDLLPFHLYRDRLARGGALARLRRDL